MTSDEKTPLERLRAELASAAPDLVEACAVHLATVRELTLLIDGAIGEAVDPPSTWFQRRTEAANFVVTLIEKRKAEGRAASDKNEAAKLLVRAIYDPDFEWRPHDGAEEEEGEEGDGS